MENRVIAPAPTNKMVDGMPCHYHGTAHRHPLEVQLAEEQKTKKQRDYYTNASLFGCGFADIMKHQMKTLKTAHKTFNSQSLGYEVLSHEIEDIDFGDFLDDVDVTTKFEDPQTVQEHRFFQ